MRHLTPIAACAATLAVAAAAHAQRLPVGLDASVGPTRGNDAPLAALSPAARVELPRLAMGAAADVPVTGALRGVAGRIALSGGAPIGDRLRLAGGVAGERTSRWGGLATWRGGGAAQLAYARGAGGLWVGAEGAAVASVEGALPFRGLASPVGIGDTLVRTITRLVDPAALRTAALTLGGWRSSGSWIGTLAVRAGMQRLPGRPPTLLRHRDSAWVQVMDTVRDARDSVVLIAPRSYWADRSTTTGDSGSTSAVQRLAELETRVAWSHGRVALSAAAGVRLADWARDRATRASQGPSTASVAWVTGEGAVAVGRWAAVTVGAGTRPPAVDVAALLAGASAPAGGRARYASVGVRLSTALFQRPPLPPVVRAAASAFALSAAPERGQYTVRVRVPAARVVELSGDFTRWRPVAMTRVSADAWEATLPITPGTHQVSIRVDGDRWDAPPGLTRVADDFDGAAGVVVVR